MKKCCAGVVLVTTLAVAYPMRVAAQAAPPAPKPNAASMSVPLEMDVVISRFQGEKKVSSQPYMLAVNATEDSFKGFNAPTASRLRIGTQVPLTTTVSAPGDGKAPAPPVPTTIFRDVGTQIDCNARMLQDGRFDVILTVAETTVAPSDKQIATANFPVLTQFSSSNELLLRDGQTRQFVVATDRISGDMVKVEVTLKVVK